MCGPFINFEPLDAAVTACADSLIGPLDRNACVQLRLARQVGRIRDS